jgi:hypothetical protein
MFSRRAGHRFSRTSRPRMRSARQEQEAPLPVPSAFAPRSLLDCARYGYRATATGIGQMGCVGCGSTAVSERSERTAQGYHRFRSRACGKQFNERSAGVLNRTQYPSDVIALVVLWRLRYKAQTRHSCHQTQSDRRQGGSGGRPRPCPTLRARSTGFWPS